MGMGMEQQPWSSSERHAKWRLLVDGVLSNTEIDSVQKAVQKNRGQTTAQVGD
jgi:hypothetical protein